MRFIKLVGGVELLERAGLRRHCPTWSGKREDLLTIGGDTARGDKHWRDTKKAIFNTEKKKILATVIEIAVNIVMSTHIYVSCGKYFIQVNGGPIGLRSTASLASIIMKLWDNAWLELMEHEEIDLLDHYRYVDDVRDFLRPLLLGVRWNDGNFVFKQEWKKEDIESEKTDQERTVRELVLAMSSLVDYLEFEGESSEMFDSAKLPTLDTEIWYDSSANKVFYSSFEKKTCPNRVLQKQTALSETCIRASLTQEVVRRLKNCSRDLPNTVKQEILSTFCQKMLNSGHSVASSQFIVVHGVLRYLEFVRCSELPETHKDYKPLYCPKNFDMCNRRLRNILARTSWYEESELNKKSSWRLSVPHEWA